MALRLQCKDHLRHLRLVVTFIADANTWDTLVTEKAVSYHSESPGQLTRERCPSAGDLGNASWGAEAHLAGPHIQGQDCVQFPEKSTDHVPAGPESSHSHRTRRDLPKLLSVCHIKCTALRPILLCEECGGRWICHPVWEHSGLSHSRRTSSFPSRWSPLPSCDL